MNDTAGHPRDHPGDIASATAAALAEWERRSERARRDNARRAPKTDQQRAREALRARLRALGREVERFTGRVEARHRDRAGNWGWISPPADDSDLRGTSPTRPRLLDRWERVEREAAAGCRASAEFLAEFGPMLRLALQLRHERPPPRAADYDPLEVMTAEQRAYVERNMRYR